MKCGKSEFQGIVDVNISAADILAVNSTGLVFAVGKGIVDNDADTKIQLEETSDEDIIRFDTGGSERANLSSNGLTLASGASINEFSTDGTLVGNSDDALPTEQAVKTYVDSLIQGLDWQDSVLSLGDNTPPGSPSTGDRYVIGTSPTGAWVGFGNYITEWNGSSWDFTAPNEGFATWVEDDDVLYTYNGASWVKFGSTVTHANLLGLQGGTSNEYYHLTSSEHGELTNWIDNVTLGAGGSLTLPSGTDVNEFSIDGTLAGNSDDAVPTEKAVKTYVDGEIGGTGPSNVLFTFGGNDNANGDRGFYNGASQTPQPATGDFAMWWTESAGYQTVIPQFKWIKIAGVSTVKIYCRIWIHSSFSTVAAQCQVDIGGQTGSVTGTNGQSTPEELNFTIDVSSLTNGTAYDVKIQLRHDDGSADRDVYLSSIIAMAV